VLSTASNVVPEMTKAHAARSIEERECLRMHASGWPGVSHSEGRVSSFAIMEREINLIMFVLDKRPTRSRSADRSPKQSISPCIGNQPRV
jgi:hypothetical protein